MRPPVGPAGQRRFRASACAPPTCCARPAAAAPPSCARPAGHQAPAPRAAAARRRPRRSADRDTRSWRPERGQRMPRASPMIHRRDSQLRSVSTQPAKSIEDHHAFPFRSSVHRPYRHSPCPRPPPRRRQPTPEQRIERLEKQVRQVQKQVFPKGQPADTAGFSDDPAATQDSVNALTAGSTRSSGSWPKSSASPRRMAIASGDGGRSRAASRRPGPPLPRARNGAGRRGGCTRADEPIGAGRRPAASRPSPRSKPRKPEPQRAATAADAGSRSGRARL